MPEKKLTYPFVVEPFQEDITGSLSWSVLGNLLLRVADFHASAHGFGSDYVKATRRAWVLARLIIDMKRRPMTGDKYCISTWISKVFRQFTDRHFAITTPEGEVLGYATSIWALIDYQDRIPVDLEELPGGGFVDIAIDEVPPISGPGRIRLGKIDPVATHLAAYSDLDINGHVNSIRYIDLALNQLTLDQHRSNPVHRVEMTYAIESLAGETLSIYKAQQGELTHDLEIRRGESTLVKARLIQQA